MERIHYTTTLECGKTACKSEEFWIVLSDFLWVFRAGICDIRVFRKHLFFFLLISEEAKEARNSEIGCLYSCMLPGRNVTDFKVVSLLLRWYQNMIQYQEDVKFDLISGNTTIKSSLNSQKEVQRSWWIRYKKIALDSEPQTFINSGRVSGPQIELSAAESSH